MAKPVKLPDLAQYPGNGRGRAECKDGALQTLTTNSSKIYVKEFYFHAIRKVNVTKDWISPRSMCVCVPFVTDLKNPAPLQEKKRFLTGAEMMSSQLLPTTEKQSALCGAPMLQLQGLRNNAIAKMAGNSMSVPCVALMLLIAVLAFDLEQQED